MKTCKKCGSSEFYTSGDCAPCARKRAKNNRNKNIELHLQLSREYYKKNKDNLLAKSSEYKKKDREKWVNYGREYYKKNKKKLLEQQKLKMENGGKEKAKQYRDLNKEEIKRKRKEKYNPSARAEYYAANKHKTFIVAAEWKKRNKDKVRIYTQNRLKRTLWQEKKLSKGLINKLLLLQKGRCACCGDVLGKDFHIDHILPIALGGLHEDSNIQLLKSTCNLRKGKKHPIDYMQSKGKLI